MQAKKTLFTFKLSFKVLKKACSQHIESLDPECGFTG